MPIDDQMIERIDGDGQTMPPSSMAASVSTGEDLPS